MATSSIILSNKNRAKLCHIVSYSVAISVFLWGVGGREGVVDDFCQARKAENTDPRTNSVVNDATARGRLKFCASRC